MYRYLLVPILGMLLAASGLNAEPTSKWYVAYTSSFWARERGDYAAAEREARKALELAKPEIDDQSLRARLVDNLAEAVRLQDRQEEANQLRRSVPGLCCDLQKGEIDSSIVGPLAILSLHDGFYADAERLVRQAISIIGLFGSPEPGLEAGYHELLADVLVRTNRASEAIKALRDALTLRESEFGVGHSSTAVTFHRLGQAEYRRGQIEPSISYFEQARQIHSSTPNSAGSIRQIDLDLAEMHFRLNRIAAAERYARAGLGKSPAERADRLGQLAKLVLARIYSTSGRQKLAKRELTGLLKQQPAPDSWGASQYRVGILIENGNLAVAAKDYRAAIKHFNDAYQMTRRWVGDRHVELLDPLLSLSNTHWMGGKLPAAFGAARQGVDIMERAAVPGAVTDVDPTEQAYSTRRAFLQNYVVISQILFPGGAGARSDEVTARSFELAQRFEAGPISRAISAMAGRMAAQETGLREVIREGQDAASRLARHEDELARERSKPAAARDIALVARLVQEVSASEVAVRKLDNRIAKEFPKFASLGQSRSVSVNEVQTLLHDDDDKEALIFFSVLDAETFAWLITKSGVRRSHIVLSREALTERIQALRCGLDEAEWGDDAREARCSKLLGVRKSNGDQPLPFPFATAHELYRVLLSSFEPWIDGRSLLIVPSGPLTSLPFNVLVTEAPPASVGLRPGQYAGIAWLGHQRAIAVLPSVASLRALRNPPKKSLASKEYVAFGNPTLAGHAACQTSTPPTSCAPTNRTASARWSSYGGRTGKSWAKPGPCIRYRRAADDITGDPILVPTS